MNTLEAKIPPLIILVFVAALMWLGTRAAPAAAFHMPTRRLTALCLTTLGLGIALAGVASFRRARTTVSPLKPETASTLVTSGVYRLTRNPMYLGVLVIVVGWAVFLANAVAFLLAPVFVLYMNRFQIGPEEKALAARFGSEFSAYQRRVRRWL